MTNFEIGRRIVEHEQQGQKRAGYGREIIKALSAELTEEFGRGFSKANLEYMRRFYQEWGQKAPRIAQTVSGQLPRPPIGQTAPDQFLPARIPQTLSGELAQGSDRKHPFALSWSHYVLLLNVKDSAERQFYEIEAASEGWSVPELKRQLASSLDERLALSRDKTAVRKLAAEGQVVTRPEDILKEPYVQEFLDLEERAAYSETDLEQAIIDRLEHFLLELGKGFLFESRQHRFTFDEDPTIGILLCKRKKDAIVELTLPPDANVHAKEYKLYVPSKELLREKLIEWGRENEGLA